MLIILPKGDIVGLRWNGLEKWPGLQWLLQMGIWSFLSPSLTSQFSYLCNGQFRPSDWLALLTDVMVSDLKKLKKIGQWEGLCAVLCGKSAPVWSHSNFPGVGQVFPLSAERLGPANPLLSRTGCFCVCKWLYHSVQLRLSLCSPIGRKTALLMQPCLERQTANLHS